ncbi:AAA family ATPase [bacterium]|nr:AAA family ATPase [bacterium]
MSSDTLFVPRDMDIAALLKQKSHFLLGPRQTGKTSLILHTLPDVKTYDLLDSSIYLDLSQNPGRIEQELTNRDRYIVIDEIQRLPSLLNEVHRLMEKRRIHFLLTGSSARKLRQGGINLLGGRARTKYLHPLTYPELGNRFDLSRAVRYGLLPSIYLSDDPRADLRAYTGSYLQQEIVAEGLTRNVPAFSRFLQVAASCNATIVNFTNIANDAQVPRTTIYEYFEILKDTLLIFEVPAWQHSRKRKPLASSKFYFFDVGVVGSLQGREFKMKTPEFGEGFETYISHELMSYSDYRSGETIHHWKSASGYEVDFILGDHTSIEIKAKQNVSVQDLKSLRAIGEERKMKRLICVCLEKRPRKIEQVQILPYADFLENLWSGNFQ